MKRLLLLLAIGLILLPTICPAAQTAQARLHCRSLRVYRGQATDGSGFKWTMDLTTINAGVNGELAPNFFVNNEYSNSTYVDLSWEATGETDQGAMVVNIPNTGDANGNGFLDF